MSSRRSLCPPVMGSKRSLCPPPFVVIKNFRYARILVEKVHHLRHVNELIEIVILDDVFHYAKVHT